MNLRKIITGGLSLLTASSLSAQRITDLRFSDVKSFKQTGPETFEFEGGALQLQMIDGVLFFFTNCIFNGGVEFSIPQPVCPAGTTGLVSQGDLDGDGILDSNRWFSITPGFTPFQLVRPGRPNEIRLSAAPISDLPRPQDGLGWIDDSVSLYYNYIDDAPPQFFQFTEYNFSAPYAPSELRRMYRDIVPGVYQFDFPRDPRGVDLIDQIIPQRIQVSHRLMIEPAPGRGLLTTVNEFRLLNDDAWNNGAIEFDPRLGFTFLWRGINGETSVFGDQSFFSIVQEDTGRYIFPPYPFGIPGPRDPIEIPNPSSSLDINPLFDVIGLRATATLNIQRNLLNNNISSDRSIRDFRWDVSLVDSYDGFLNGANPGFPIGTGSDLVEPDADFDGDGFTNIQEWATLSDPADPAETPIIVPQLDQNTGQCIIEIGKRPSMPSNVQFIVEYLNDENVYVPITANDPNWIFELDNDVAFVVRTRMPAPPARCIVRFDVRLN